jgi:tRNA threonylcarbamoyl adenosine modification protein (Sua5/YciO/YrdC/YwlC family)
LSAAPASPRGIRAVEFERVITAGGVVLFPSDTVYGLACDPMSAEAIARLYALKDRPPAKASAVMFFELEAALTALPELGQRTRRALRALLPGPFTALLEDPAHHFPLASPADPGTLGLRVVAVPELEGARVAVLQSSANPAGGHEVATLAGVAPALRTGADLVIDGGELPGTASTVVDLRELERSGNWSIVRAGAASAALVDFLLGNEYVFSPATYTADVIDDIHDYRELQRQLVLASLPDQEVREGVEPGAGQPGAEPGAGQPGAEPGAGQPGAEPGAGQPLADGVSRILELGTGTGESAELLLAAHPGATLDGLDATPGMLAAATLRLPRARFRPHLGLLQEPLPEGPFELVASALALHHLDGEGKAALLKRIATATAPGGRFVLADVVVPEDPADAVIEVDGVRDRPSPVGAQLAWLRAAGFAEAEVRWRRQDLAVIVARR